MRTTIARVLGTLRALVVPVVKTPGSPVWYLAWPWGMVQRWRRGDSKWGVSIGHNVGLHIHAGRLEAWTNRRRKVSRRGALERHPLAWRLEQRHNMPLTRGGFEPSRPTAGSQEDHHGND